MNQFQFKDICDECETIKKDLVICLSCEQIICLICNNRVHNKGNRLKHPRIISNEYFYRSAHNKKFIIYFLSFSIYRDYFSKIKKFSYQICNLAYEKLIKCAKKGKPMIILKDLKKYLQKKLGPSEFLQNNLSDCLLLTPKKPIFHKTERNLGENIKIVYFSICLDEISLESLIWVLKSIYRDRMEPNQVLIQSRFKEYFAIKIPMKEWNIFVKELNENVILKSKMNYHSNIFGEINVVKNREDNFIFKLKHLNWDYEDNSIVNEYDLDYKEFLNFINLFFDETKNNKFLSCFQNEKIGLSSVKNSKLRKSSTNSQNKLKTLLKTQNIKKAIPGGMYGCVLLLRNLKNKIFDSLSMGRLHALIKKALKDQIIIHYKTLIIKDKKKNPLNDKTKRYLIEQAKKRILILLEESGNKGITLAQMHNFLIKRFGKKYDFPKLGFPKLKNFLMTIDSVYLDHGENINHIKAKLKKNRKNYFDKTKKIEFMYNQSRSHRDDGLNKIIKKNIKKTAYIKKPLRWNEKEDNNKFKSSIDLRLTRKNSKFEKKKIFNEGFLVEDFVLSLLENEKEGIEIENLLNKININFERKVFDNVKNLLIFLEKNKKIKKSKKGLKTKIKIISESFSIEEYKNSLNSEDSLKIKNHKEEEKEKKNKTGFQLISGYSTPNKNYINTISLDNLNPFSSLHGRDFPNNGFNQYTHIFDLSPREDKNLLNENKFCDKEEEKRNQELEKMVIKNINSIIDDNN